MGDGNQQKTSMWPKVFGWIGVATGFGFIGWWCFHLPTAGKAGLALAIGATLMPLIWEKVGVACRMAWIAMLFVFLFVEYKAIDQDKAESARELQNEFKRLSDQSNANLRTILEDEHKSFTGLLKEQQNSFTTTLRTIVAAQHQDERQFSVLLKQQRELFDHQQEMIESLNGHLLPGDEPMPSFEALGCERDRQIVPGIENAYFVVIGNLTLPILKFPSSPIEFGGYREIFTLTKDPNGVLGLVLDFRSKDGSIIVKFDDTGFEVSPFYFKRHPNKSTLIVTDLHGIEVLKVVYANKHLLRFNSRLIVDGQEIADTLPFEYTDHKPFCYPVDVWGQIELFKRPDQKNPIILVPAPESPK
jgi:hypothetical protein